MSMPTNPLVLAVLAAAAVVILLSILSRVVRGWSDRRQLARVRNAAAARRMEQMMVQAEIAQAAAQVIATSSTGGIAGYRIVRQIEAVFIEGAPSPGRAVEMLKATTGQLGGNAIIHLATARLLNGKCVAQGDAVVVDELDSREED
ncbi:MAG: hypothetical protein ACKVS9_10865 [Phycisphaerae bacterium]